MNGPGESGYSSAQESGSRFLRWVAQRWCCWMHPDPMWPINGRYRCPVCHRTYPVPWAVSEIKEPEVAAGRDAVVRHWQPAAPAFRRD